MFNLILLHLSEKHFTANEFLTAYWHRLERFNASFFFGKKVLSDSMSLPFKHSPQALLVSWKALSLCSGWRRDLTGLGS